MIIALLYGIGLLALFLFSYTQVDLSLTLTQASLAQQFQTYFQHIGFYLRPWATYWYIGLIVYLYSIYAWILFQVYNNKITLHEIKKLIVLTVCMLFFSYPAFSYDIFNYMFYAKEILVYHKNPYEIIPLQFTGVEPWLSFMHWTHVPNVFAPLWTMLTLPFYLLGLGYFLPTLWSFKMITAIGYIITCIFLVKILGIKEKKWTTFGLAVFAFNPLVLIESLVSAHNDIVMMGLAMVAIYEMARQRQMASFVLMSISASIKTMTTGLVPFMFFGYRPGLYLSIMSASLLVILTKREIMPWYFLWIVPFSALLSSKRWITILTGAVSAGLLLRYAPYFYFGHWNSPVPEIKFFATLIPISIAFILVLIKK